MFYRETGQFKTSYAADDAIFPIRQDFLGFGIIMLIAFVGIPLVSNEYYFVAILVPFLISGLAALGLNILTGYAGQLSLGAAAFMSVGAFSAWNFITRLPEIPFVISFILSGLAAAAVGVFFGIPSLRIKGFYLAVATLAAQFFIEWIFTHVGWFYNYDPSGSISTPPLTLFGFELTSPISRYYTTLTIVSVLALLAKNMMRCSIGRDFMAVRDMDIAAEVIGIPMLKTKLLAFAISSFYLGIAGALWAFTYLGNVEPAAFDISMSLRILFMIIVGGVGTILGSFIGAAFILLLPIFLNISAHALLGDLVSQQFLVVAELMVFGGLIIFFLIIEPQGMARLWQIVKEKIRMWPFPY
ncbi:MAG: branched-chain amino acid ABC transporter permease [SAR324 cluster bacterium]|nr:branched-chain amino acid ABC transporter permease [SAR324 cluster bacterium]